MPGQTADYPVGTAVRILDLPQLEEFQRTWKLHHPLAAGQLSFAGRTAVVGRVGFYFGGDVIYELEGIPGIWHGCCLRSGR